MDHIGSNGTALEYMTAVEAAQYLRLSPSTLAKLRMTGGGPGYLKLGRKIVYSRSTLVVWLESHRRRNTSQAAPNV